MLISTPQISYSSPLLRKTAKTAAMTSVSTATNTFAVGLPGLIELSSCRENKMGETTNTYLKSRESWNSLREVMKKTQGVNIVPYSFRHSYSLRAHIRGIDAGSVAMSMGHSLEAHLRAYPWASKASTAAAFALANEKVLK